MPKFLRQEKGLLIPPPDKPKWHISWTLDNVLEGFREFNRQNGRWPMPEDLAICKYLPNVKTLERKFGGITSIRKALGITEYQYNRGLTRSEKSKMLWKRGVGVEQVLYQKLVKTFHEPFVHNQSRVCVGDKMWRVDFLVYFQKGKFAIDIFFPEADRVHFFNNTNLKFKLYRDFPFLLFLCVGNSQITTELANEYALKYALKKEHNSNIRLITENDMWHEFTRFHALPNPYEIDS